MPVKLVVFLPLLLPSVKTLAIADNGNETIVVNFSIRGSCSVTVANNVEVNGNIDKLLPAKSSLDRFTMDVTLRGNVYLGWLLTPELQVLQGVGSGTCTVRSIDLDSASSLLSDRPSPDHAACASMMNFS